MTKQDLLDKLSARGCLQTALALHEVLSREARVEQARRAGSTTSAAKRRAARLNGLKAAQMRKEKGK